MQLARIATVAALALVATACGKKQEPAPQQAGAPAAAPAATGPILIGHVASMTGEQATFGQSTDNAIRLAIKEANAAGGVKGRQLEVKTYDDQGRGSACRQNRSVRTGSCSPPGRAPG